MKLKNNSVKIEITKTKDNKICIDITTSKEVVVNVGKENEDDFEIDLTETKLGLIDTVERVELDEIPDDDLSDIVKRGELNASFDSTDVVIRDSKNNKEQ